MRSWFTAAATNNVADIAIHDEIGFFGISSRDFRDQLMALGEVETINLGINSPGGDVFDGIAIYNMLTRHPATVNVTVDGIAASIASLIAMAGDQITMPENAMMMVHNPFGGVVGTADDMLNMADALNKIRDATVTSYARRTGMTPDALIALMDAETWMTAAEAKAQGFADEVTAPVKIAARFDLARFAKAPRALAEQTFDRISDETVVSDLVPEAEPVIEAVDVQPGENDVSYADVLEAGVAAAREKMQQIAAACQLAGYADRTLAYLQSGKTLSQVQAELLTLRAARGGANAGNEISPRHNPVVDTPPPSWDSALKKINARFAQ